MFSSLYFDKLMSIEQINSNRVHDVVFRVVLIPACTKECGSTLCGCFRSSCDGCCTMVIVCTGKR